MILGIVLWYVLTLILGFVMGLVMGFESWDHAMKYSIYYNLMLYPVGVWLANSKYKILMFTITLNAGGEQMRSICDYRKR